MHTHMFRWLEKFIILGILLGGITFVSADTNTKSITVTFLVSNGGGGGGGGGNNNPAPKPDDLPTISNITLTSASSSATVSWTATDDKGIQSTLFEYGLTTNYGLSANITGSYLASLSNLATDTLYYYRISVTDTGNQTVSKTDSFRTLPFLEVSPTSTPVISAVQIKPGSTTTTIVWKTDRETDSQLLYGLTSAYGATISDLVNKSINHSLSLFNLSPNTSYHYRLVSTDSNGLSGTTMDAVFTTLKNPVPPPNVFGVHVATTTDAITLSWQNPSLEVAPDFKGVRVVRKIGSPANNSLDGVVVYEGSGETITDKTVFADQTYFYTIFSFDSSDRFSSGAFTSARLESALVVKKVCNAALCADPACQGAAVCQPKIKPPVGIPPIIGGPVATSSLPAVGASSSVPSFMKLSVREIEFLAGNRQLTLPIDEEKIYGLSGDPLTIRVATKNLLTKPERIEFQIENGGRYLLRYDQNTDSYYTDILFPEAGAHAARLEFNYGADQTDVVAFTLHGQEAGLVTDGENPLSDVEVSLFKADGTLFSTAVLGKKNPINTERDGTYGWTIPSGRYFIKVTKEGYFDYSTEVFELKTVDVINRSLRLVKKTEDINAVIKKDAPLLTNISNVSKVLGKKFQTSAIRAGQEVAKVAKAAQEIADNPKVEQAASNVVAPTTVGVVAVSAAPLISWVDVLPLLRLVFFQPILLIGSKKREKWGQVYNSLNKLPVDLAIVRLIDKKTNRVVQSRVTDKNGRYFFTAGPGNYRLEVLKDKMQFPSNLLLGYNSDGRRTDIYHGEDITVGDEQPVITASVPVDPLGANKTPRRLVWEKIGRTTQNILSWFGLGVTALSFYISPKWYVGALLVGHILVSWIFRRLATPPKPKGWGIIYDETNKKPISRAIARLFSAQFNKLISTQVTDGKGRYYFLAGDNNYYVTYEHHDYLPNKSQNLDLNGKDAETIAVNIGLAKKTP